MAEKSNIKHYGLFTAITMIVGIVIGSGIFFKSDNVLVATGGNVFLGVLVFCFAAIAIVFGCLTLSVLAAKTDEPGGIFTYSRVFLGEGAGAGYGFFQAFVYLPTIAVILSWVSGVYISLFVGLEGTLEQQCLVGFGMLCFLYFINILSAKLGGYFQNITTVVKLIPLLIIAFTGMAHGGTGAHFASDQLAEISNGTWLLAIPAIAFSFDGWIIATSVSHEVKNAKRNLPIALVVSPLFVLAMYLIYFVGISNLVGPAEVIQMGDAHLDYAANMIFGPLGAKLIMFFVIVSVLGGVNGLVIGTTRMPYSLALRDMFPGSDYVKVTDKREFPLRSAFVSLGIIVLWYVVHYFTQKYELLPNSDISEIAIVVSYLMYLPLYYQVLRMGLRKEIGPLRGIICPILAAIGSLIIFSGGLQSPLFILYIAICMVFIVAGFAFYAVSRRRPKGIDS